MNFKEVFTWTRPSIDTPWGTEVIDRTERSADYQKKYLVTGKVIYEDSQTSNDELTIQWERVWLTEQDYRDYRANPLTIQLFAQYTEYNNNNNIVSTKEETLVDNFIPEDIDIDKLNR